MGTTCSDVPPGFDLKSPERCIQAISRLETLSLVICSSGEYWPPPESLPKFGQSLPVCACASETEAKTIHSNALLSQTRVLIATSTNAHFREVHYRR